MKRKFKAEVRKDFLEAMKYHFDNYWYEAETDSSMVPPNGAHYWQRFNSTQDAVIDIFEYVRSVL